MKKNKVDFDQLDFSTAFPALGGWSHEKVWFILLKINFILYIDILYTSYIIIHNAALDSVSHLAIISS